MEVAALAGLLAVGYALTKGPTQQERDEDAEQFVDMQDGTKPFMPMGGQPAPVYQEDKTRPGALTSPGKPRVPRPTAAGEFDQYYGLPTGGTVPGALQGAGDMYSRQLVFGSPAVAPQAPPTAVTAQVRMNDDGIEAPPVYNSGKTVISPLTGLPMNPEEFTHNNMVPFFRGEPKQNMSEGINQQRLDYMVGSGKVEIAKREQAPLFDPHREPTGNISGLESMTDFMQDRMVLSSSRANEVPVEKIQVGPGLGQGYSSLPIGGFQQMEINDIMRQFKSVDETRVASDPKITYEGMFNAGKAIGTQRGDLGEVRKYRPDTFFLNESGERNFVTAGENTKPMERPAEVMKFQARTETSREEFGVAAASDFKATYTTPSFRAPLVRQHDGFGYRNADGSTYGVKNTDAPNNDFGREGYDLPTNQRNVTSERGQGLNVVAAGVPKALTVYDPVDWTARTTVRESTAANDWIGIAASASAPTKLTVYDPTDITRVTGRNTLAEPDRAMNVTRTGIPGQGTLAFPDGVRLTTKENITAKSEYTGSAGAAVPNRQQYGYAYAMNQNPTKEMVSAGRKPVAGNGSLSLFNGEDYMNVTYRRPDMDSLNDRANVSDRVIGPPLGAESIGLQRPRQPLELDIAGDRNIHEILDSLNDNPYALPVHRIAAGLAGPAEMAAAYSNGGYVRN
jgi:hypothetical protein